MAKHSVLIVGSLLVLVGGAAAVHAQTRKLSVGIGYQWLSIDGSKDSYRTQVNDDEGAFLDSLALESRDTSPGGKLFDRLRIDGEGLGANPQGRLHLDIGLARVYELKLTYFRTKRFSALPALANPLLGSGIVPGQHTYDRASDDLDLDLELLPGRMITPLLGYRWYRYEGSGRTTVHAGQDEFRLGSDLDQRVHELRAGVAFSVGGFRGTVMQAWRSFDETEKVGLLRGAGGGNSSRLVLGRDQTLDAYGRRTHTEGDVPMTTAYLSGRLASRVRLVASFVRAEADPESSQAETLSGSLVSFDLARYFGGLSETARAKAEAPDWRGSARVEAEIVDGVDLVAGYSRRHRELDGWATVASLYTATASFGGADPKDVRTLVESNTAMERDEKTVEATVSSRNLGPVRLWAGWSKADQELTVTPDAAEIVVPGGQGGHFEREVKQYSGGAAVTLSGLRVSLDFRKDDADRTVVRTDFLSQKRWRARADWTIGKMLRIGGTAERIDAANPSSGARFNLETRHAGLDLELTPSEPLSLRVSWGRYKTDSAVTVRVPQDFTLASSLNDEKTDVREAALRYKSGRVTFDGGYSWVRNHGSFGLRLNQGYLRCDLDVTAKLGLGVRVENHEYDESKLDLGDFNAWRYGLVLRWSM